MKLGWLEDFSFAVRKSHVVMYEISFLLVHRLARNLSGTKINPFYK